MAEEPPQAPPRFVENQRSLLNFELPRERVPGGFYEQPKPKVYFPAVCYDWTQTVQYSVAVHSMIQYSHAQFAIDWLMNDGVARARNNAAWKFLHHEQNCEFMLLIDNDIEWQPKDIDRMLAHNRPVVAGLYPKKQGELCWVFNGIPGESVDPATKLLKVRTAGTGFMLIRRDAIERLISFDKENHPTPYGHRIMYHNDPGFGDMRYDFFPMHAEDDEYLSEDWFFCKRCYEAGIEILVDVSIQVRHVGRIVYPLCSHLSDTEIIDIVHQKYDLPAPLVSQFLAGAPKPPKFDKKTDSATGSTKMGYLWPDELVCHHGISIDHCAEVLAGAYDLPLKAKDGKPAVFLDIGANIGAFARFVDARWPGSQIYCYEPHPGNFNLLRMTLKTLKNTTATPVFDGVSKLAEPVYLPLRLGANSCSDHSLYDLGGQSGETINCRFVGTQSLPEADVLKLSTCGHELVILRELAALGRLKFDGIAVEYFRQDDHIGIVGLLTSSGYRLIGEKPLGEQRGYLKFLRADLTPAAKP
jgi:FkbM family methyltransferase